MFHFYINFFFAHQYHFSLSRVFNPLPVFLSSRAAENSEECLKTKLLRLLIPARFFPLNFQSTVNNCNETAPNSQPRTAQHSKMFHHLSHTAHRAISIHNILEVSWTSHKTIQMNSKRSQSLNKGIKIFQHSQSLFS